MAKKKKTVEVAPDETTVAPEATVVPTGDEPPVSDESGMDVQDSALAGIEGTLVVVNAEQGLNLRRGPHPQYDVIEVLPDGAVLVELELPYGAVVKSWSLVHTGQHAGWVVSKHILPLEG